MRNWFASLVVVGLVACTPTAAPLSTQSLDADSTRKLLDAFNGTFQELHLTLTSTTGRQYTGKDGQAFKQVVTAFYQNHPGFCPIENAFYLSETTPGLYMTVTSNDQQVALLIYDQRKSPLLSYVVAEGVANPPLPSSPCTNRTR